MKTVRQILGSKGTHVYTVTPEDSVLAALELMAQHDLGALVVLRDGEVAGVLSERDYARKVILKGKLSRDTPVAEIMNEPVLCVNFEQTVEGCMGLMTEHRIRHLPVLEEGQLAGIISIGDVVKTIMEEQQLTIEQLEHYITGTPG